MGSKDRASRPSALVASLLAVAVLALAGCSGSSSRPGSAAGGGEVDPDATLRYVHSTEMGELDPHRATTYFVGQIAMRPIFDSLLSLHRSPNGETSLAPELAEGWEVSSDGLAVTFRLRSGVTFQDGAAFDAEAVKANLDRALGEGSTISSLLPSLTEVEVVDAHTVVCHLAEADSSFLWAMGTNTSGMMASPASFAQLPAEPVGAGPYRLISQTATEITYERWDGYWDPDVAVAKKLVISTVSDVNARYNGLQSGQYDVAFLASPLDAESKSLESQGYHWRQVPSPIFTAMLLNSQIKPFDDVRVRRAISMAIDRRLISDGLLNAMSPPAYQPFLSGFLGHDPELENDPHDLDDARELIEEAGASGTSFEMIYPALAPYDSIATAVQQALGDIGLEATLTSLDGPTLRATWQTGQHASAVTGIAASVDPASTLLAAFLGGDEVATPRAELVDLANRARTLPVGSDEQGAAYREIAGFLDEVPTHIPIVQFAPVFVARPNVVGSDQMAYAGAVDLDFRGVGISK